MANIILRQRTHDAILLMAVSHPPNMIITTINSEFLTTLKREIIDTRIKTISIVCVLLSLLWLSGCDQESTPGYEIHDTKYQSLGVDGQLLNNGDQIGSCVLDQYTGLMWQVKSEIPGLNDWHNTYTWYNPEESGGPELDYRGTANGGSCRDSDCDTWDYVKAVNKIGLCGFDDWRIPSRDALASISDLRKLQSPPTTNMKYFLHTQAGEYWSSNDYDFQWDSAWTWNYKFGHDRVDWKASPKYVRLVRGTALQLERVED